MVQPVTGKVDNTLVLFALDLEGQQKWKIETGPAYTGDWPGARLTPTVDGDCLYLAVRPRPTAAASTPARGKSRWTVDAKEFGGRAGGWGYAESPLVLGKLLVFKPGGQSAIMALQAEASRSGPARVLPPGLSTAPARPLGFGRACR